MYKLYARQNSGSAAVEALLAIIGAPHEIVEVEKNADDSPPDWFLAVNPRGRVPVIELPDGSVMTESAAIMIQLTDLHPEAGLAPAPGTAARAKYLQWMINFAAEPYQADLRLYYPTRYSTDAAHADGIKAQAIFDLNRDFDIFANQMGEGPFLFGQKMCAFDIYAVMLFNWSEDVKALFMRLPKLKRMHDAVVAIPEVRKAWQRNEMFVA